MSFQTLSVLTLNGEISVKKYFVNRFDKFPTIRAMYDVSGIEAVKEFIDNTKEEVQLLHKEERVSSYTKRAVRIDTLIYEIGVNVIQATDSSLSIYYAEPNAILDDLTEISKKHERKDEDSYISIIVNGFHGLSLQAIEIPNIELDIDKTYNDDFKEIDIIIKERLNKQNDKGVILLHGKPGTGKTTYIRHLINSVNKRIIFVPPSLASNLTDPSFLNFLMSYPNSILIIEDAESVITDRKLTDSNSVSNLLNLSDGLLSDMMNIQVLCTFNSDLNTIDKALLRKGRIIAKYEFKELSIDKCNVINKELGIVIEATEPMVLADLYNQDASSFEKKTSKIGF